MAWLAFGIVVAIGFATGTVVGWLIRDWLDDFLDDGNDVRPSHIGKYGDGFPGCLLVLPEIIRSLLK